MTIVDTSKTVELIEASRMLQREIVLLRSQIKVLTDELMSSRRRKVEVHERNKQLALQKTRLLFGLGNKIRK